MFSEEYKLKVTQVKKSLLKLHKLQGIKNRKLSKGDT